VWDRAGNHSQIEGPCLLYLWFSTIRFLTRKIASPTQYLRVEHVDGSVSHVRGPKAMFENPGVLHQSVKAVDALLVPSAGDAILVVSQLQDKVQVVEGPTLFFPEPNQSVVEHQWTLDGHTAKLKVVRVAEQSLVHTFALGDERLLTLCVSFAVQDLVKLAAMARDWPSEIVQAVQQDLALLPSVGAGDGALLKSAEFTHLRELAASRGVRILGVRCLNLRNSEAAMQQAREAHAQSAAMAARESTAQLEQRLRDLDLDGEEARRERLTALSRKRNQETLEFLSKLSALKADLNVILPAALRHPKGLDGLGQSVRDMLED
jgi:hypothetical protein